MIILVSNDDGFEAPGLRELARAAEALGEVWVVAPDSEMSAVSHALTMHRPLRVTQRSERAFAVSGTPADCVYLAVHNLLPEAPALVLSGINRGANLGDDVHYSGTVAAAMEACLMGLPAVAVSLYVDFQVPPEKYHFGSAAEVAVEVSRDVLMHGLPRHVLLNLNVPDRPREEIRGVLATRLGHRHYHPLAEERRDPRGRPYYWIGGSHDRFEDIPSSDGPLVAKGFASLTPLQPDMTSEPMLEKLQGWSSIHR